MSWCCVVCRSYVWSPPVDTEALGRRAEEELNRRIERYTAYFVRGKYPPEFSAEDIAQTDKCVRSFREMLAAERAAGACRRSLFTHIDRALPSAASLPKSSSSSAAAARTSASSSASFKADDKPCWLHQLSNSAINRLTIASASLLVGKPPG